MNDLPIACSLDAGDMSARLAQFDELARDALIERCDVPGGVQLRLRNTAEVAQRARRLIAAEARCCPFLAFDLRDEGGALRLEVTGSEMARPVIDELLSVGERA